jgi:hypothetical protein
MLELRPNSRITPESIDFTRNDSLERLGCSTRKRQVYNRVKWDLVAYENVAINTSDSDVQYHNLGHAPISQMTCSTVAIKEIRNHLSIRLFLARWMGPILLKNPVLYCHQSRCLRFDRNAMSDSSAPPPVTPTSFQGQLSCRR